MSVYKVLVAEDEGLIALDIASRLEALGHTVVGIASTAAEAIELAGKAEVVLMDIRLDGPKDGIDAAREIRRLHHLPVIFLTAHADRRTVERAKLTEPFGYIVKPMAHASLQTTLEVAMYKHSMERQLEERESWLRTTLGSVADAVVVTDVHGRAILANQAAETLFACPPGGVSKLDVAQFLAGDPVALSILRDGPVPINAVVFEQAIEGSAAPVKASGVAIGSVVTLRNVTLQRWQEQQLRQAQKMEAAAKLAGTVVSQYTSLLAIVHQETQRLLTRFSTPSSVRQSLEKIQQSVLEAEEINNRLAGFGSRQSSRPEPVSINGILRRMRKTLESVVGARVRLAFRPDPSAAKVFADPEQIEQMILNLVAGIAADAPGDSEMCLETGMAGNSVRLSVLGTASGTQLGPAGQTNLDPNSLELSLAFSIATEFGGMIELENNGASVILPAWEEPVAAPPPQATTHTLLLVEPRESVRTQLHNFFEAAGYNMLEAASLEEARALLELHAPVGEETLLPGEAIDLVLGETGWLQGIDHVPVLFTDQPAGRAISQNELLDQVRARLAPDLTFSASA